MQASLDFTPDFLDTIDPYGDEDFPIPVINRSGGAHTQRTVIKDYSDDVPQPNWVRSEEMIALVEPVVLTRPSEEITCECVDYEDDRDSLNSYLTLKSLDPPVTLCTSEGPAHAPKWRGTGVFQSVKYKTKAFPVKTGVHRHAAHLIMNHFSPPPVFPFSELIVDAVFKDTLSNRKDEIEWIVREGVQVLKVNRGPFVWQTSYASPDANLCRVMCEHRYNVKFFGYQLLSTSVLRNALREYMVVTLDGSGDATAVCSTRSVRLLHGDSNADISLKMCSLLLDKKRDTKSAMDRVVALNAYQLSVKGLNEYYVNGIHVNYLASCLYGAVQLGSIVEPTGDLVCEVLRRVYGLGYVAHLYRTMFTGTPRARDLIITTIVPDRTFSTVPRSVPGSQPSRYPKGVEWDGCKSDFDVRLTRKDFVPRREFDTVISDGFEPVPPLVPCETKVSGGSRPGHLYFVGMVVPSGDDPPMDNGAIRRRIREKFPNVVMGKSDINRALHSVERSWGWREMDGYKMWHYKYFEPDTHPW